MRYVYNAVLPNSSGQWVGRVPGRLMGPGRVIGMDGRRRHRLERVIGMHPREELLRGF